MKFVFTLLLNALVLANAQDLQVEPRVALSDAPVTISLSGFEAGSQITLRAHTTDGAGVRWESDATFEVSEGGTVEVARQEPLAGSYEGADPMGLFWSMTPQADTEAMFVKETLTPQTVTLSVEVGGETVASTRLERLAVASDVTRTELQGQKLVGTLFTPPGGGPHPAILVLGGSEGGFSEGRAALLASHGYAALALAYFGVPGLPDELIELPLETFADGLEWLAAHPEVDAERIAVVGASKGAEAALLLASSRPEVRAVVAYAPSNVVWQGISFSDFTPRSSWSEGGEALAFVPYAGMPETLPDDPGTVVFEPLYRASLERYDDDEAFIPVEAINGPVLLISGGDDRLWHASDMSAQLVERLEQRGFTFDVLHLDYEEAGHFVNTPYLPTIGSDAFFGLVLGGTPEANAEAAADSWPQVRAFLAAALQLNDGD